MINQDTFPEDEFPDDDNGFESEVDDEHDEEDDVTLDQLSAAYAQVMKEQNRSGQANDHPTGDADSIEQDPDHAGTHGVSVAQKVRSESANKKTGTKQQAVDDDAACPISPKSILESILFVGGPKEVKLNSRKIAALMRDVSPKEITALVKELNADYKRENRAFHLVTEKGAIRMELHPEMLPVQDHMLGRNRATKLTQQAIDVLAIVAYNQPVGREQVDKIRGRTSGPILNQMVKRDLLAVEVGETKPKSKQYRTTDRFLDLFGLDAVEDLPQTYAVSDVDELADE